MRGKTLFAQLTLQGGRAQGGMHLCAVRCPDGAATVHVPVHRLSFRHHAAHSSLQSFLRLQHDCILLLLPSLAASVHPP